MSKFKDLNRLHRAFLSVSFSIGLKAVIRLLTGHHRHRKGDIRLRLIRHKSVDAAGFEQIGQVDEENLSKRTELFDWERRTREQWQFVRHSSANGKRPARPKQHKALKNAEKNKS
ncbi:hypothetical protein AAVH_23794 [Aphelenchoides avenae]|nr:hypothetical protein AAVH_23794 [Aphelenchus avenae]